jgi:hypothetical protein
MPEERVKLNKGFMGCSGVREMTVFKLSDARNGTYAVSGSQIVKLTRWYSPEPQED